MKIAVTYDNGDVFQHFGHTKQFKIYEVENNFVVSSEIIDITGSGHDELAGFLAANGVRTLICGGIGGGAKMALAQAGIRVYPGASGDTDGQVEALLAGDLEYDPNTLCSHHDEHHGDCGGGEHNHSCGGGNCCH